MRVIDISPSAAAATPATLSFFATDATPLRAFQSRHARCCFGGLLLCHFVFAWRHDMPHAALLSMLLPVDARTSPRQPFAMLLARRMLRRSPFCLTFPRCFLGFQLPPPEARSAAAYSAARFRHTPCLYPPRPRHRHATADSVRLRPDRSLIRRCFSFAPSDDFATPLNDAPLHYRG